MRILDTATQTALEAETVAPRDFLSIFAKRRDSGEIIEDCYWSDEGTISADIIDPITGLVTSRTFQGGGAMIQASAVPLVVGLTVQNVTVQFSQVDDRVQQLLRTYDIRQARVELHRGMVDPQSGSLVSPATPRFSGFVDQLEVPTAKQGDEAGITATLTSHTQEVTRSNPATRSDADQRLRSATDGFFRHVATIAEQNIFWGQKGA